MRAALALSLLVVLLSSIAAQDAPASKAALERNYFMYNGPSRVGWFKSSVKEVERDGKAMIEEKGSFYISIVRNLDAQPFRITIDGTELHHADGTPFQATNVTVSGPQTIKKETSFSKDKVTVKVTVGEAEPRELSVDCKDKPLQTTLGAWKKLKAESRLKAGEKLEFNKFDDNSMTILPDTWTVIGKATRKTRDGKVVEGMEIQSISGGHAARYVIDENGMPWFATITGGFTLEPTGVIPADFKPDVLELEAAMESDVGVKEWRKLNQADVLIPYKHDDGDGIEPLCDTNEYHDVEKFDDKEGSGYLLRLKPRKLPEGFAAPKLPMADLPGDVKRFLAPTAMCQSDDADLATEADKLAGSVTDSREAARKICNWVFKYLKKATGDTASASAKQAYNEKKGDCTEHAALFVALARAAGLPARNISGIVYLTMGETGVFGYHAWSEVWLGQWVPVDATVDEIGTSARYIYFGIDEPGETSSSGRVGRCMGQRIKPQIQAWRLEDGTTWQRKEGRQFKPAAKPEGESK